jgi:predicted nucleotidyltransferase
MRKAQGVRMAKSLKSRLKAAGYPIREVFLFGSVAKGTTHPASDIDVAIFCDPFLPTRHEENVAVRQLRRDLDLRIEPICLHPEDFEDRYSTIVQEIRNYGIPV